MRGELTVRDIATGLTEEYDLPVDDVISDTIDFMSRLVGFGVVELVAG
ncbi:hypothetical protein [Actinacidiphila sp. ITFR-21]